FEPAVDLALGLVLCHTVALLKPAAELRALTLDDVEIVVGQLAPLLLNLAFELFPIAFNSIPIHRVTPVLFSRCCASFGRRECPAGKPSATTKVPLRLPPGPFSSSPCAVLKKTRA